MEAEAWNDVLETIGDAERHWLSLTPAEFGRWHRVLPANWRTKPAALLASALELQARAPVQAVDGFRAAAEAYKANGDVDGELAAISREGYLRWLTNDVSRLVDLYARVGELAADGSERAQQLQAIAIAALGHLQGDSATVLSVLAGLDDPDSAWYPMIGWLRSVAHRRNGDLRLAHEELDRIPDVHGRRDVQGDIARLRVEWLEGRVDHVPARLSEFYADYTRSGDRYLAKETGLELAGKAAWLGDVDTAREILATCASLVPETTTTVCQVLAAIASAAVAVTEGDEARAAALLEEETLSGPAALGSPQSWYWRDRAAVALVHVLVPATRGPWAHEALGAAHAPGLVLAEAIEAARAGDLEPARELRWPEVGVTRAHLPVPWIVELAAAAAAARNPPPGDLLRSISELARSALHALASTSSIASVAAAARQLANQLPTEPAYRLRITVLGPTQVHRDGDIVDDPALRRKRVRELLCYLAARRRARREAVAEELFPNVADPGHNLRVTLNHLQGALQPDRAAVQPPYFLRASGPWLELIDDPRLDVDVWELEARLDEVDAAERNGLPATALRAYRDALPLWRGEPFDDAYEMWAEPERARLRRRYVTAAVRAGELWLAAHALDEARRAADYAIQADPTSEPAYRLLAHAHLANDDPSGARDALQACRRALTELGVEPDSATDSLAASISS